MKNKYLFFLAVMTLFFAACDPNKELYEELDALETPYHKSIAYTFTSADYTEFSNLVKKYHQTPADSLDAKDIASFLSFSPDRPIDTYPLAASAFFKTKFVALDSLSSIELKTNYSDAHVLSSVSVLPLTSEFEHYILVVDDYTAMGGAVATNKYITSADLNTLGNYIKSTIFPNSVADNYCVITFEYNDGTTTYTKENYYIFNGSYWKNEASKTGLTKTEYTEMGVGAGYGYFTSTLKASTYLPLFLKEKNPYALVNDKKTIIYRYQVSSSLIQTHIATFIYNGTKWSEKNSRTETFFQTGSAWVYDITKRFTMMAADYQILADWTKDNHPTYYNDVYKNEEYFFGASAYYKNFNVKLSTRRSKDVDGLIPADDTEAITYLDAQVIEGVIVLLETKYLDMLPSSGGIDQYVEVTYLVYNGTASLYYKAKFKCVSTGQFEFVEVSPN